jgi:potassium-transporting ATPase KdpC subunit
MRRQLLPALRMVLALTVLVGIAYPLVVLGVGQLAFADKADGSFIEANGRVVGSELLGQSFSGAGYFWTRPSAAGSAASGSTGDDGLPVDPADQTLWNSGGSNLGPTNETLITTVEERVVAYREAHALAPDAGVPTDAVTASGSGVDPHISIANARIQATRVAAERGLDLAAVSALVDAHTEGRSLGVLGEPGVNVLTLNVALDQLG